MLDIILNINSQNFDWGIVVNILLVLTTIWMAYSANRLSKKTLLKEHKSILRFEKMVISNINDSGSLVFSEKIGTKSEKLRFILYAEDLNKFNAISKIKVISVSFHDADSPDDPTPTKQKTYFSFKFKQNETNDPDGYQNVEYLMYPKTSHSQDDGKAPKGNPEDVYRLPIVFGFGQPREKTDFLEHLVTKKYMMKIKMNIVVSMGVNVEYTVTLINHKLSGVNNKDKSLNEWSYVNDFKTKM